MEFSEYLKSSLDIVNVVGEYVRLKRVGSGQRYSGLCPFHTEKTPSFYVHREHQYYKCFGCGVGGDVYRFVMELERLTFPEAMRFLAERNGIPMPQRREQEDDSRLRSALHHMHETAAALFQKLLESNNGAEARAYLQERGVAPEVAHQFGLGLSDRGGQVLVRKFTEEGIAPELMEESGLVLRRQEGGGFYDRFRGRLMFPIHNESGKIIGFGGRALQEGDEPKYLNSAKTKLYDKSAVLYHLHGAKEAIRREGFAILVEGYMDVIGVAAAGVGQVVATCGTALTPTQVKMLRRHADNIVVNFDPDRAGAEATEKSIAVLLEEKMHITVLSLEDGLDPDEFIKTHGPEAYRERLQHAQPYFYWLADRARKKFDTRSAQGRIDAFQWLLPSLNRLGDRLQRVAMASDVAAYLGVEPGLVLDEFRKSAEQRRVWKLPAKAVSDVVPAAEVNLVRALLRSVEAQQECLPVIRDLPGAAEWRLWPVLQSMFQLVDAGTPVNLASTGASLDEPQRTLLESLVLAEEQNEDDAGLEARENLRVLEAQQQRRALTQLRNQIKTYEREGNFAEALRLMQELGKLERSSPQEGTVER